MSDSIGQAVPHTAPVARRTQDRTALVLLVAATCLLRLPGITRPLVGNFATKNVVYAMIARNWARGEADLWHPTLDCVVGNGQGLHLLEMPLPAYLAGTLWWAFGGSLDVWGRLVSVLASAGGVALIYTLMRRWHSHTAAVAAAAALALSPLSIIYGQAFQLEASLVFLLLMALEAFDRWVGTSKIGWLIAAGSAAAAALLVKPYAIVVLGAGCVAIGCAAPPDAMSRRSLGSKITAVLTLCLACLPAFFWCLHVWHLSDPANPTSSRVFYSLRDSALAHQDAFGLLKRGEFYRQMLDDLAGIILTPIGLLLALIGLASHGMRRHAVWLLSTALLILLLPRKFYELNYYYLLLLPVWCVAVGLGWECIAFRLPRRRLVAGLLLLAGLVFALRYSVRPAFVTPTEDRAVLAAGQMARMLTDAEERVATMHGSTLDLVYYSGRKGWAISPARADLAEQLVKCRRQGARLLVVADLAQLDANSEAREQLAALRQVRAGDDFAIYELPTLDSRSPATLTRTPDDDAPARGNQSPAGSPTGSIRR